LILLYEDVADQKVFFGN
jgi:hypothetical protein